MSDVAVTPTTPKERSADDALPARGEYILYALPRGPLGRRVEEWFSRARAITSHNAALAYPPHCSVTGFFHDDRAMLGRHVVAVDTALTAARDGGDTAIGVGSLRTVGPWYGLELDAPWLSGLARDVRDAVRSPSLDEIRPKNWLHVSLAYDFPEDAAGPLADLAEELLGSTLPARWDLALLEREPSRWTTHARWPL